MSSRKHCFKALRGQKMLGSTYQLQDGPSGHLVLLPLYCNNYVSAAATQVVKGFLSLGNCVIQMKLKGSMDLQEARFQHTEIDTCSL